MHGNSYSVRRALSFSHSPRFGVVFCHAKGGEAMKKGIGFLLAIALVLAAAAGVSIPDSVVACDENVEQC
jgi:hypothetical protein